MKTKQKKVKFLILNKKKKIPFSLWCLASLHELITHTMGLYLYITWNVPPCGFNRDT